LTIQLSNGLTTKLSKYKKAEFEAAILSWFCLLMNCIVYWWSSPERRIYFMVSLVEI
jgi:hypothetical protein